MIYALGKLIAIFANKLWFNITFKGKENIPVYKSMIVVPNHVSMYDPVAVATQIRQTVHFIGKKELYDQNWFVRTIMKLVYMIPVDRSSVSLASMRQVLNVLKQKGTIGIFPDGTRVRNGKARPKPMDGFVVFALKAQVPILPVHIEGDFKFRGKVTITYGKLIYLDEYYGKKLKREEINRLGQKIMDEIYAMK